jgi:hypothetical protein
VSVVLYKERIFIVVSRQSDLYEMCCRVPRTKKIKVTKCVSVNNRQMHCLDGIKSASMFTCDGLESRAM